MSILLRCRGKKRSLFDLSPTIYKDSVYYWGCGRSQYLGHSLEQGERGCSLVGSHSKNLWGFLHVFKWGTTNLFAMCYPYKDVLLCPLSMNNRGRFVVSLQIIWWQQLPVWTSYDPLSIFPWCLGLEELVQNTGNTGCCSFCESPLSLTQKGHKSLACMKMWQANY